MFDLFKKKMTNLKAGDKAPDFTTLDQDGNNFTLSDNFGKKIILFFYPKDDTPTCTKEACNLRDNYSMLRKKGYDIIGVSPDGVKSHQKFIKKFELPFRLITDEDRAVAKKYDVYGPKMFMGREIISVHRTTFVIDEKGILEQVIRKVKSGDHANQILEGVV